MPVKILEVESHYGLYMKYDSQTNAQDVFIELDCQAQTLYAEVNPEIGNAVPFAVWHGHRQRWGIPVLTADSANKLLKRIAPLAEAVCEGYERVWDGRNHVAEFTEEAQEAIDAIREICERAWDHGDTVNVWEAADWLGGIGSDDTQRRVLGITAETTDDELDAIVQKLEEEAEDENVMVDNLDRYVTRLRDEAVDLAAEEGRGGSR